MFKLKKRSRLNYWSNSRLANLIRGTPKPAALEWNAWDRWHKKAKKKHSIRYWIAEELLDRLQDTISFPLDLVYTARVYIRNRFIDQTHILKTGLTPGEYYDFDTRILYGLFNELIDLVEIEYASLAYSKDKQHKFIKGRCVEAGLDYLNWACGLRYDINYGVDKSHKRYGKLTQQAIAARKVLKLYQWWKNRSNRPDPNDLFNKKKDGCEYFLKIDQMENNYFDEDNKMLIELIKIRNSLWT